MQELASILKISSKKLLVKMKIVFYFMEKMREHSKLDTRCKSEFYLNLLLGQQGVCGSQQV